MGGFSVYHWAAIGVVFALWTLSGFGNRWLGYTLVLRGYRLSDAAFSATDDVNGYALSEPMGTLFAADHVHAVIIGRPAGLINFLREGFGLSRRFEFAFSSQQAALRMASFTSHEMKAASLDGLSAIEVSQQRLNPLALLMQCLIVIAVLGIIAVVTGIGDGAGLLGVLVFIGYVIYYFISRVTSITLFDGKDAVLKFVVHPAMLERLSGRTGLDLPLDDANRLIQLFRRIKGNGSATNAPPRPAAPLALPASPKPAPPPAKKPSPPAARNTQFCDQCGAGFPDDAVFCEGCGAKRPA